MERIKRLFFVFFFCFHLVPHFCWLVLLWLLSLSPLLPQAAICPLPPGGETIALVTVGWPSIPSFGSGEPTFSLLFLALFSGGGSTRLCFLGKQQWTLFSQSLVSQILIFAHWPSSLQLFPTADHFLRARLAASAVPALLGRQPSGAGADVAHGLGLWSESRTASSGKCACDYLWSQWAKSRAFNEQSSSMKNV